VRQLLLTATVLFLLGTGSASANPLTFTSCVSAAGVAGCQVAPSGDTGLLNDPIGVALAPGGTQLYVSQGNGRITWLRRDQVTGAIELPPAAAGADRCIWGNAFNSPCRVGHIPLVTPHTTRITPDGASVYVGSTQSPFQLHHLTRVAATGGLTFSQCLALTTAGCSPIGIANAAIIADLAVSPDGASVYAAHSNATAILNFTRAGDGTLTFRDCVGQATGCAATGAFPNFQVQPQALVVSPDGSRVYVSGATLNGGGRVVEYSRGAGGTLTQSSCIGEGVAGCGSGRALSPVNGMAISPDGRTLYTLAGGRVGVIDIASGTGDVSQAADATGCLADAGAADPSCTAVRQLGTTTDIVVAPAGDAVYVTNTASSIAALDRAPDGDLSQPADAAGCVTAAAVANCVQRAGLAGAGSLAISSDGLTLMLGSAGAGGLGTVTAFTRDLPPVCSDADVSVPFQTPQAIPLTCSDRNGDALTYEIVSNPAKGQVTLSQSPPQVIYAPLANNSGGDAFTFRATARGRPSNVATVRPTIGAPPVNPPPGGGGGGGGGGTTVIVNQGGGPAGGVTPSRIDSPVSTGFKLTGVRTRVTRLLVRDVPAGSAIEVRCRGPRRSCPYKTKRYRVRSATARVNLLRPFAKRTLAAATTIEVRITKPGTIGKVSRITTRRRKLPLSRTLCLPVGVTAPQPSCLG
jgi:DNA-binding beta-propeller fold protein YncE